MASGSEHFIGIDVGGTKILGILIDPKSGEIAATHRIPTPKSQPQQLRTSIIEAVSHLIEVAGPPGGIGVGLPGLVDHDGVLRYGPNVAGVVNFDIHGELEAAFDVPITVENDGTCAAIAEHRLGAARGADIAVVVTQGTGIGGGLIIGGRPMRGANGFAGEFGHMLVDRSGPTCACGRNGCWESVSSGTGLANLARQLVIEGRAAAILALAGGELAHIRGEHVSTAFANGDSDARLVLARFADWVAEGVASLVTALDPDVVVLGGGLTVISEQFLTEVSDRVMPKVMGYEYRPRVPVVAAEMGEEAGAIGAALSAADLVS